MEEKDNKLKDMAENLRSGAKDAFDNIKDGTKDAFENIKEGTKDVMADAKEAAKDAAQNIKEGTQDFVENAKDTVQDVKEETQEVVQEAKAAAKGEKLETADTVGAAGYRAEDGNNSFAIASLVLGIISIICGCIAFIKYGYVALIGVVAAIVGIVLGAKARKESQTHLATAGFVCSIIGLVFCAIGFVCIIICVGAACAVKSCS